MTRLPAADPALGRLADAVLLPPFAGPAAPAWIRAALGDGLAGVTLFGLNVADLPQLARLAADLKSAGPADAQPIVAIDEEGGDVTRISHQTGSDYPGNAALGAVDDVTLTQAVYAALGAQLASLGITLNLAPTVDVNTAADNPVIGTRAFGADTALVARHAAAAVAGLQSAGVAACAKHFPGHGSTQQDSHDVIPTIDAPLSLLRARDLPPFEAVIAAGVRAIMPSHLRVPELTGQLPASLSPAALTGLLRGELGFTGLIISDALEMRAVSEPYGIAEAAVLAMIAGTDLLVLGRDVDQRTFLAIRDALAGAVSAGRLPAGRLEEAAARVAELRAWIAGASTGVLEHAIDGPPGDGSRSYEQAGGALDSRPTAGRLAVAGASRPSQPGPDLADGQVGLGAARRAVLVTGDLPRPLHQPLVVQLVPPANIAVGSVPWGIGAWLPAGSTRLVSTQTPADELPSIAADVVLAATGRSLLIVVRDAHRYPAATSLVEALLMARPDAIVVEMGLPIWRPQAASYVASYGAARSNALAVAAVLGLGDLSRATANLGPPLVRHPQPSRVLPA